MLSYNVVLRFMRHLGTTFTGIVCKMSRQCYTIMLVWDIIAMWYANIFHMLHIMLIQHHNVKPFYVW